MRMVIVTLASCLSATAGAVVALFLSAWIFFGGESVSSAELTGIAGATLIFSLLTCVLIYAPGLYLLRRRRGGSCEPLFLYPLVSVFILNIPVFLILLVPLRMGLLSGWGEVLLIFSAFLFAGLVFGFGFVWNCRKTPSSRLHA